METPKSIFGKIILWSERALLIVIFMATLMAMSLAVWKMIEVQTVSLGDLLLLFLFLEIIAMISIFHKSDALPVRFPIYIAITALTRYLTLDQKNMDIWTMLIVGVTILLLVIAVLVLRIGLTKFPLDDHNKDN